MTSKTLVSEAHVETKPVANATHKKLLSFAAVGIFNTVFNIIIFDLFVFVFHMGDLWANFVSLVISISISYFLNKLFVFKDNSTARGRQLALFLVGTFAIQLSTQHLAVWLLGERYAIFGRTFYTLLHHMGLHLTENFVVLNVAKGVGVAVAITLSYLFYDRGVFKPET